MWSDQWDKFGEMLRKNKGRIIVMNAKVVSDDFSTSAQASVNQLVCHKFTQIKIF